MGEKPKVRVGDDGELEYVQVERLDPRTRRSRPNRFFAKIFSIVGLICSVGLFMAGGLILTGNVDSFLCAVGNCPKPVPTSVPVGPTTVAAPPVAMPADLPCTTEILSAQREKIAFLSNRQTEFGAIHLLVPGESQSCLLLTPDAGINRLVLAPDGRTFWFETSRGWWAVDSDGRNSRPLETADPAIAKLTAANVSPDQAWTLSDQETDGNRDIYKTDANGQAIRLTTHAARDAEASWSPDGTQIIFVSYRDGNHELYVMNADGAKVRRLTQHLANDHFPVWFK